jgi:ComEC/Rec2-related protein
LYTLFVGALPTVSRAAVMGTIVVLGQQLERRAHAWTTLFAACWAMTQWDPQTLWDLGFQLSALATASLFAFGKGTERLLLRTPLCIGWLDWACEALTAMLAAQSLTLPLLLSQFGNPSIVTPLANVVLLPIVPYAVLSILGSGWQLCGGACGSGFFATNLIYGHLKKREKAPAASRRDVRDALLSAHGVASRPCRGWRSSGRLKSAFVERVNLTVRQSVAALMRRTWSRLPSAPQLLVHLECWRAY